MRNLIKLIGVFILITLIALTITSCPEPVDSEGFMAGGGGNGTDKPGGGTPGGGIDPHTHNWSSWTQTKAPTETQDGSETRTCSNNPVHSETRPIPALGHTCVWGEWIVTTPETCTVPREEKRFCSLNNAHYEWVVAIKPSGHDYEWKQTTAPTFIAAGVETNVCNRDSSHTNGTRPLSQLEIKTTDDWSTAKTQLNGKTGNYTLTINGSFSAAGSTTASFGTTANGSSLHVTLKGSGKINLTSQGNLLCVDARQTLVIDSASLTFEGFSNYNNTLAVYVGGGTLELKNGTIIGNNRGGVFVNENGAFTMNGGTIKDSINTYGGGVYVLDGTFTMTGGTISSNTATVSGGGVYVGRNGTFTMTGGTISDNTASPGLGVGGGVMVVGTFNMNGGAISGNTAAEEGGGVMVVEGWGIFTMNGGTISGNSASEGGGVYVRYNSPGIMGTFRIINGTIHGTNEPNASLRNTATTNAALSGSGIKERGTFSGTTWNKNGDLTSTDNTIKVVNGVLQP